MRKNLWLMPVLCCAAWVARAAVPYAIGDPVLQDLWVDPVAGVDTHSGLTRGTPLRTLTAAWSRIPQRQTLTGTGFRIRLLPGSYACEPGPETDNCQNDVADRWGSAAAPIIVQAEGGPGTVTLRGGLNLRDLRHTHLVDLTLAGGAALPTNSSGNNLLHLEGGHHLLLRGLTLAGPACSNDGCNNLQEVLKVNQTQHLYVEDCSIGGAWHSSVDYFAVQYGHFIGNRVHTAGQWGMYVKGGSAYLTIEGNTFTGTQLGFQAGQAANFAMMRSPWLHHEAYDIRFVNNLLTDIPGVGVSVAGGYNVLIANNTLVNVATSTEPGYPLMSFVRGERNCTPTDELPDPVPVCRANADAGGWGPAVLSLGHPVIPNRRVLVIDNLMINLAGRQSAYSHFGFDGPVEVPAGFRNIPQPSRVDDQLQMAGNVVWNGHAGMPTGAGEVACLDTNPDCNDTQLRAANSINTVQPQLLAPTAGNHRPAAAGPLAGRRATPIPAFTWTDAPARPALPAGTLDNTVSRDIDGLLRPGAVSVGAYSSSDSMSTPRWIEALDCLMNWAQIHHADLFWPAAVSVRQEPYHYRHFTGSASYLGGLRDNQHLMWLDAAGTMNDLGTALSWLAVTGCAR